MKTKTENQIAVSNFLANVRVLRTLGSVSITRENVGACEILNAVLDGTSDRVSIYRGVLGNMRSVCAFTKGKHKFC